MERRVWLDDRDPRLRAMRHEIVQLVAEYYSGSTGTYVEELTSVVQRASEAAPSGEDLLESFGEYLHSAVLLSFFTAMFAAGEEAEGTGGEPDLMGVLTAIERGLDEFLAEGAKDTANTHRQARASLGWRGLFWRKRL